MGKIDEYSKYEGSVEYIFREMECSCSIYFFLIRSTRTTDKTELFIDGFIVMAFFPERRKSANIAGATVAYISIFRHKSCKI